MARPTLPKETSRYLALTHGSRTAEQIVPASSAGPLRARIHRPEGAVPFPTVAYFHGGGYVIGDLDTHDNMCRERPRRACGASP